LICTTEVSK